MQIEHLHNSDLGYDGKRAVEKERRKNKKIKEIKRKARPHQKKAFKDGAEKLYKEQVENKKDVDHRNEQEQEAASEQVFGEIKTKLKKRNPDFFYK